MKTTHADSGICLQQFVPYVATPVQQHLIKAVSYADAELLLGCEILHYNSLYCKNSNL